jgi:hypothetical protein
MLFRTDGIFNGLRRDAGRGIRWRRSKEDAVLTAKDDAGRWTRSRRVPVSAED